MDTRELEVSLRGRIWGRAQFLGVYSSDTLPHIRCNSKPVLLIVNTLNSKMSSSTVGHWVCIYIEFNRVKRLIFYDSYGLLPGFYSKDFSNYINEKYRNFNIFDTGVQIQPDASHKCGLYALHFIHFVSHYGLDKFIASFKTIFNPRNLDENDARVTRYYFKNLYRRTNCSQWKSGARRAMTYAECVKMNGEFHHRLVIPLINKTVCSCVYVCVYIKR